MVANIAILQRFAYISFAGEIAFIQLKIRMLCVRVSKRDNIRPIETTHGMPLIEQRVDQMGTDEASPAQYQRPY